MTFELLKGSDQLVCSLSLSLGLSDVFSCSASVLGKGPAEVRYPSLPHVSCTAEPRDADLEPSAKVVTARLSSEKVTVFPFLFPSFGSKSPSLACTRGARGELHLQKARLSTDRAEFFSTENPPFSPRIHPVTSSCRRGLTDIYFILWTIIQAVIIYFAAQIIPALTFGSSFRLVLESIRHGLPYRPPAPPSTCLLSDTTSRSGLPAAPALESALSPKVALGPLGTQKPRRGHWGAWAPERPWLRASSWWTEAGTTCVCVCADACVHRICLRAPMCMQA